MNKKEIDFYMESPYPTFLINEQTGGKVLLRRWKGGISEYRSLLLTSRESNITHLEDLLGKVIAFEDPGSTSGYFLPKAFLLSRGFTLTEKSSFDAPVSPQGIGYLFAEGAEENIVYWVLLRKVAAGALSNGDFDKLDEKRKAEMVILAETETVPRHLLSVRKDLDPAIVNRLKEILLSMHQDEEGQKVLKKADKTSKFDLLPEGEESMYQKITELFRLL
jgi:phosphonate transport system substrate-binding protein